MMNAPESVEPLDSNHLYDLAEEVVAVLRDTSIPDAMSVLVALLVGVAGSVQHRETALALLDYLEQRIDQVRALHGPAQGHA